MDGVTAISLPVPTRLRLNYFSIYDRRRAVDVRFDKDVFCLAGANGLGKSTFLAALNFALTGTVPRPELNFLGPSQFYEECREYSARYFDGRISSKDRENATVEIEFEVGGTSIRLVRGMFEPESLRELSIDSGDSPLVDYSSAQLSDEERHERYVSEFLRASGFGSFAQFVFLQLLVLTFDEDRRLLFWSERESEQALFLAFGVDAETSQRAERLQRQWDKADSQARNIQWQATGVRSRLTALREAVAGSDPKAGDEEVESKHRALTVKQEAAVSTLSLAIAKVKEAELRADAAGSHAMRLRQEYERAYAERLATPRVARVHPLVQELTASGSCGVCGNHHEGIDEVPLARIEAGACPLCDSSLPTGETSADGPEAKKLFALGDDLAVAEEQKLLSENDLNFRRAEQAAAESALFEIDRALASFREANTAVLLRQDGSSISDNAESALEREIAELLERKESQLTRRNEARKELDQLRASLISRFAEMEAKFVPDFRSLAEEFLGIPIDVDLVKNGAHVNLKLTFSGSERLTPDALSESQKFFIDIALRMAFARAFGSEVAPATLFVDTPEGSLDIAYESRAGKMFGKFADGCGRLVMTANINTSQLLLELATVCDVSRMELLRMTEWSSLTDVQLEAEDLFTEAFSRIEEQLAQA